MSISESGNINAGPGEQISFASGSDAVVIDSASLLFNAEFTRDGRDLILQNADAADIRIVDYFHASPLADLQAPDGATLRGDLVEILAGPLAPGQYAQAGAVIGGVPIGQVEALDGQATVQRSDGVTETLQDDTKIFQNDVVQTDADSKLSITFADGTVFTLAADSRMVINELIYAPDAQDNGATFNLIQGGFVFIAGKVAATGGMDINTPAATMGIRGTTVLADIQSKDGVSTAEISLTRDPDGSVGKVALFDLDGDLITTITSTTTKWIVSTEEGETREVERTEADDQADNVLIAEAVAAYQAALQRFSLDGKFIELNSSERPLSDTRSGDALGDDDADIDLDNQDREELPELAPLPPTSIEPPRQDRFDEGNNNQDIPNTDDSDGIDVTLTTQEDADGSELTGQLPSTQSGGVFAIASLPVNGTVVLGPDGSFSYEPAPDFNGTDTFAYTVSGPDGIEVGSVTVNVTPVNDAPTIEDVSVEGVENTIILGTAIGNDVDGDPLTYNLDQGAAFGTVVVTSDGAWSYTPDPNFNGTDTFTIQVSDPDEASSIQTVTVNVEDANDPPVITSPASETEGAVTENSNVSANGQLAATDPDSESTPVWSGGGSGQFGTFAITASGAWTYVLDERAEALQEGQTITEAFVATVTDDEGASQEQSITIDVTGTNDLPTVGDITLTTTTGTALTGTFIAQDLDANDSLTFTANRLSANGGTVTVSGDTFLYTPATDFFGRDVFEFVVTDEFGGFTSGAADILVVSDRLTDFGDQTIEFQVSTTSEDSAIGAVISTVSQSEAGGEEGTIQIFDLSVELTADGESFGTIAFLTNSILNEDGSAAILNLADINGIENLLGTENQISATAAYTLDGETVELELFASEAIGKQESAQTEAGSDQSDLIFGSDQADTLGGLAGTDLIFGFAGDDTLSSDGGLDHLYAGADNDLINLSNVQSVAAGQITEIDGGTGRDRLAFSDGGDINDALDLIDLSGIEALDIENGAANTLELSLSDILAFSDEADTELETLLNDALPESASVYGDSSDQLNLLNDATGQFVDTETSVTDANGTTLNVYQFVGGGDVLATLAVDSDVTVTTNAQPAA
ncbi:MAG: Ig-like domain-containing protein [Paracoccaceae bacterium]